MITKNYFPNAFLFRALIRERWTALADAMDANDVDKVASMLEAQEKKKARSNYLSNS